MEYDPALTVAALGGFALGGAIAWLWAAARARSRFSSLLKEADRRADMAEVRAGELDKGLENQRGLHQKSIEDLEVIRERLTSEQVARARAETRHAEILQRLEEEKKLLDHARGALAETFKSIAGESLEGSGRTFLMLAGEAFEKVLAEAKGELGRREQAIHGLVRPLSESLKQFEEHLTRLEKHRQEAYAGLSEQLKGLSASHHILLKETGNLVSALRTPKVVGSWGQMTLRRVVELAGMSMHCDFTEEVTTYSMEGRLRPDLVVHLPSDREIVIDAKATFDAYREAMEANSEEQRKEAFRRHAAHIRSHMTALAAKSYWQQFYKAPEFVVMFLPGESFFAAAVDTDRQLMEDGLEKRVILATPTTLISLLRAVAYGWRQEQVTRNAQEISELGRQLYDRMRVLMEHVGDVGKHLEKAASAYNSAVGSIEVRVLPAVRRFKELGAASGSEIPVLSPLEIAHRSIKASADE